MKKTRTVLVVAIVVACVGAAAGLLNRQSHAGKPSDAVPEAAAARVSAVLGPVKAMEFEDRLVVQGNVEAKNCALVSARIPGTLDAIYVDEGDTVEAGKTKLFQVDSLKLQKALEMSRQALAVAKCSTREKEASLERTEADFRKAEIDFKRYERLKKDRVVSDDAFEQYETRYLQATVMLKHGQTLIDLAKAQEEQAAAALAIAAKDLADSVIYAPISGTITQRLKEPGETADTGKPVLKVEDLSLVEVCASLPAEYYGRVLAGETQMNVTVNGGVAARLSISCKSPTIQPKLRTFDVKCLIKDPSAGIVPGAMAEIDVVLEQHPGLGVPLGTVQPRGGKQVIFTVQDGKARMVAVKVGLLTNGFVEVSADGLAEGTAVVTMGQSFLNDGTPVDVRKGTN